jgi:type I restriction enzyme R subunit
VSRKLANEAATVQFPLVAHAEEIGWAPLPPEDALHRRGGEAGAFLYDELRAALLRLNPGVVTVENVDAVIQEIESAPATIEGNRIILDWLRGKRTVYVESERRRLNVALVDFENPENNAWHVTWEWTSRIGQRKANRADVLFLINGIPIAIVENKNPRSPDALERAVVQLRRYELETPELLVSPQVFNVTHLLYYHYGVTWNYTGQGIYNWKARPDERYRDAVQTFFEHAGFLRLLRDWILFFVKDDELQKTVLRQHQTRAVEKVVERCADPSRRRGLVWHTQGSGKTFTLLTSARQILEDTDRFAGATVVLVVDRTELEGQLAGWVERVIGEMQQARISIEYVESRAHLEELLRRDFRGLIVSMIHKFEGLPKNLCTRRDVFVFIDEAHRSVGGDLGNYLVGALPNATLIGFTGTPVDKTAYGLGTFKTFGVDDDNGYLDKYTIRESIEDGTTVPLRHAQAPVDLTVPAELLEREFLALTRDEAVTDIEDLNRILERAVNLRSMLKSRERVERVAEFVARHFRENVNPLGYKAFLVAVDREACALYKEALDRYLPPEWTVPVYTRNAADAIERPLVARLQLEEASEKAVRKAFPKAGHEPRIFIVTDKLLTGFDAPILYCVYLDKPMRDHVLLQAVARVNRPYEDERGVRKPCGLVVDFVGVLRDLNKALAFDSGDVSGVIEDLDELLARFIELMNDPGARYLSRMEGAGGNDAILEQLLYEDFLDKDRRREFAEFFQEVQGLYEILSPAPELRDHVENYQRLADLYVMLRNQYASSPFLYGDVARKTERLVREQVIAPSAPRIVRTAEFDSPTLEALHQPRNDNGKVVNLVRQLRNAAEEDAEPYLLTMVQRAEAVLDALEERQLSTTNALDRIEAILREKAELEQARAQLGLDARTFAVYSVLRQRWPDQAVLLAREIGQVGDRFPNAAVSGDEFRQLKGELYKILLRVVSGSEMVRLGEQVLDALRLRQL